MKDWLLVSDPGTDHAGWGVIKIGSDGLGGHHVNYKYI